MSNPRQEGGTTVESADGIFEVPIPRKKPADDLPTSDLYEQSSINPIHPTGQPLDGVAGRVEGIHLFGGLHGHEKTITRFRSVLNNYDPDIVAVEACPKAVAQHHPDLWGVTLPLEDEMEVAGHRAQREEKLSIAGIDRHYNNRTTNAGDEAFVAADQDVFRDFGLLGPNEDLTPEVYYQLDWEMMREWRTRTQDQVPAALFDEVIATRDDIMAGHLHELYRIDDVSTVVGIVGVQHLMGILDRLQDPYQIPSTRFEQPPVFSYEVGELDDDLIQFLS